MALPGTPTALPSPELISYSNARNLIAEASALFAVATLTVLFRCYVRIVIIKSFGYDDWTMLLAMVSQLIDLRGLDAEYASLVDGSSNTGSLCPSGSTRPGEALVCHSDEPREVPGATQSSLRASESLRSSGYGRKDICGSLFATFCDEKVISLVPLRYYSLSRRFHDHLRLYSG
jgi:hypothetical protein